MMSQPYVHGITETLTHHIASSLTAGHIAADGNTLSVAVVCPDRWFPATSRWSPAATATRSPAR